MNKKHLLAIVLPTIALMVALPSMPAFAANKADTEKFTQTIDESDSFCQAGDIASGYITAAITEWDNGKLQLHESGNGKILDPTRTNTIGEFSINANEEVNKGGLPVTVQENVVVTCNGSGQVYGVHIGETIDENGNVHFHHMSF